MAIELLVEQCAPGKGCGYIQAFATGKAPPCDDLDPCTAGDGCAAGQCQPGKVHACVCTKQSDCDGLEEGNLCNGIGRQPDLWGRPCDRKLLSVEDIGIIDTEDGHSAQVDFDVGGIELRGPQPPLRMLQPQARDSATSRGKARWAVLLHVLPLRPSKCVDECPTRRESVTRRHRLRLLQHGGLGATQRQA